MKIKSIKTKLAISLGAVFATALVTAGCLAGGTAAFADGSDVYGESYRNKLAFSAKEGWNNDPNGLLYADGVYHMYYQYNWDKNANGGAGKTENVWGHMSWGHATSTDLVHWIEQPVALPENTVGADGKNYGMMFSGSAVYDETNTSGLFETENGKVKDGHGIAAVLTQPDDSAGGQRQILAYSKDDGASFEIYGEVLGANAEGSLGDGEFRDPKIFWNEKLSKWLMVVGGGAVRMYSSADLKNWDYLGQTGYWGECPDISRYTVGGEEKYVLIISPEDKNKSHEYNGTNRAGTYYPAEYYVVGDLNERGLFVSREPVKRLSEGIDCYAFQSFNNAPDGKVYGVSWAASWKTVGEYEKFRKTYNGGMTAVCELKLEEAESGYKLSRYPVAQYEGLRGDKIKEYRGALKAGDNAFAQVKAKEADIVAELDFSGSNATYAQLCLRVSEAERISVKYDVASKTLTLDRSRSSLLAKDTPLYKIPYSRHVELDGGKLNLRILLDRAFVSVFANGGETSVFSAVFPSAVSNGMELVSDGDISVDAAVYAVNGIFGNTKTVDELILSTEKIDTVTGAETVVAVTSFAENFNPDDVELTVTDGSGNVRAEKSGGFIHIEALQKGSAKLQIKYKSGTRVIEVYIYENGFESNVNFEHRLGGFSFINENGLRFATGSGDAFLFGDGNGKDISYSAELTPLSGAQAGGLVFGVCDNLTDYWVATADFKEGKIKLWKSGVGDLKTCGYGLNSGTVKLTVTVSAETAKIFAGEDLVITHKLENYNGGKFGLNVYNAEMDFNKVAFANRRVGYNSFDIGGNEVSKVVNVTDGSRKLAEGEYAVQGGVLTINESYLFTLEENTEYTFRVITPLTDIDFTIETNFTAAEISSGKSEYSRGESLTFTLSEAVEVEKLEINGKVTEFTVEGNVITVSAESVKNLIGGEHTVKAYTSKGRPELKISVIGPEDFREDEIEIISHTFFYIDIAVFSAAIVAYAVVAVIKKCKKNKR